MNKTPLITAVLASACAAITPSVKKPEMETGKPFVQEVQTEQTQSQLVAIYESVRAKCAEARQQLADERMEKIESCICKSPKGSPAEMSPREQCFEDQEVPLHNTDYDPVKDEAIFEQNCLRESTAELGADFEDAKDAYKASQTTKFSYKHKAIFANKSALTYEEAQDYLNLALSMHDERIFYDKKMWKILNVDNMDDLYNHYFKEVAEIFKTRGYVEEAETLESSGDIIKLYYGAPEQFLQPSKITEYFIRAGLINAPIPSRCTGIEEEPEEEIEDDIE